VTPSGVSAVADGSQVTIGWNEVTGATVYTVCWRTSTGVSTANGNPISVSSGNSTIHSSLTNGTQYFYVVTAENPAGNSTISSEANATPTIGPAPIGLTLTSGNSMVAAAWNAVTGSDNVTIFWSEHSNANLTSSANNITVTGNTYVITGLTNGTSVYTAIRSNKNGSPSSLSLPLSTVPSGTGGDYLILDIGSGYSAESYPVSIANLSLTDFTGTGNLQYKTDKIALKRIPAGAFTMGSPVSEPGRFSSRETQHPVTLTQDYFMAVFEITQTQWKNILNNTPSNFSGNTLPVEKVSWDDIRGGTFDGSLGGSANTISFIGQLISKTGLSFDLPSEAQWEYACRSGTTSAFSYGSGYNSDYLWSSNNSSAQSHEVGSKLPNPWGLFDMHGNIVEWCRDWHVNDYTTFNTDPVGPNSGSSRIVRGGNWQVDYENARSAGRGYLSSDHSGYNIGFRLSLIPAQ
ncbi:MAG: formylglycine-generating enzyme family protein, partial [Planctomycetes bacterium]|nr:formylglycine-generating enzyme family protein [Planctomycetota bacterium]